MIEALVTLKPSDPHWTTILSALLTPIVAAFAGYIAYRQWRTAHVKLKFDLFEKRIATYEVVRSFVMSFITSGKVKDEAIQSFLAGSFHIKWIFDEEISRYVDSLYENLLELRSLMDALEDPMPSEEKASTRKAMLAKKAWLRKQPMEMEKRFSPYLWIERPNFLVQGWLKIWNAIPIIPIEDE